MFGSGKITMSVETSEPAPALFTAADSDGPVPKIYVGTGTGSRYRHWEFEEWCRQYGHMSSCRISHGWRVGMWNHVRERDYCMPIVMDADLRCDCDARYADDPCLCLGDLMHRGACTLCDWEGPPHNDENLAAEDALDHAWPGWRDLPVVDPTPDDKRKQAKWLQTLNVLYPEGWVEQGGPIKTWREWMGGRHVPNRTPFGGYDVGIMREGAQERWEEQCRRFRETRQRAV